METIERRRHLVSSDFYLRKEKGVEIWKLFLLSLFGIGALGGWWFIGGGSGSSKGEHVRGLEIQLRRISAPHPRV